MTLGDVHSAFLRPAVLQILRAAGFNYARPAVVDTVTDLAARYLLLLSSSTAQNSFNNHNDFVPTIQDVRLAMAEAGALAPQMSTAEENARGEVDIDGLLMPFEDMRGVEGFVSWAQGPVNKEIRRISGFGDEANVEEIAAGLDEQEDYLTGLKKKHSKTGEESRYQGTLLGRDSDIQLVTIVGGPVNSIEEWSVQSRSRTISPHEASATPSSSGISSDPLTPIDYDAQTPTEI